MVRSLFLVRCSLLVCHVLPLVLVLAPAARAEPKPASVPAARMVRGTISHQGRKRGFYLRLPRGHDPKRRVSLVLALHGGGGTAEGLDRSTNGQLARGADKRGWIVCFPQGVAKGWNDGRKLVSFRDRQRRGVDDVGFLSALIDRIVRKHGADPTRVYATGISNGGFMSYRLGLDLSDKIAAIAPVAANLQKAHAQKRPRLPVGLLVMNGTKDPLVPYGGGFVLVFGRRRGAIFSTDETMRRWAAFDACKSASKPKPLPDRAKDDGARAFVTSWAGCTPGVEVMLVRVEGGGHTWPGGRPYMPRAVVGAVCRDFDAVPMMFDFFARHRRAQASPR